MTMNYELVIAVYIVDTNELLVVQKVEQKERHSGLEIRLLTPREHNVHFHWIRV